MNTMVRLYYYAMYVIMNNHICFCFIRNLFEQRTISFRNVGADGAFNLNQRILRASPSSSSVSSFANGDTVNFVDGSSFSTVPDPKNGEMEYASLSFSPSNVRRISGSSGQSIKDTMAGGESSQRGVHSKLFSSALQSVVKGVVPAAETAGTLASRAVYGAGVTVSGKFGECLVGHSKEDFEQAVRYKQELLTELSYARTALGDEQDKKVDLQCKIEALTEENAKLSASSYQG